MEIMPLSNFANIAGSSQHDERKQQQRKPPQPKRERIASAPIYTPSGEIEQEQPPKIDVLV
ncbi:MAG TPA: hypothetical protein VGK48_12685 [Terriglobia bacterium]|jgi:hypothetical protein